MPAGDGTGPMGMGPMTGRAAGFCAGYATPGYLNPVPGRGFGLGMGLGRGGGFWGRVGGRGRRNMYYATGLTGWQRGAYGLPAFGAYPAGAGNVPYAAVPTREQQLDALKGQAEYFEDALNNLRKRMEELESDKAAK